VGDGPLRGEIEERIRRDAMGTYVHLLGARRDVPALLGLMDVYLFTSRSEGLSNALMEAAAAGLPAVATRVGGNIDVVHDGATGLLAPAQDRDAMTRAVLRLLGDAELRSRYGRAARRLAEREFDAARNVARIEAIYHRLLDPGTTEGQHT